MAINYPSSLDALTNPTSSDYLNSPNHADQHANANDAVEALEAKLGIGSSPAASATAGQILVKGASNTTWTNNAGTLYFLTGNVTTTSTPANTLANITGLTHSVTSGTTYFFESFIFYESAATTTGSRFTVNGPSMTAIGYSSEYTLTSTTTTLNSHLDAVQLPAAANATSLLVGNVARVRGFFTPSANGTFAIQFASEVNNSALTAKAGSFLRIWNFS